MKEMDILIEAAEQLGWFVKLYEDKNAVGDVAQYAEFEIYTPAGEDLIFEVNYEDTKDLAAKVEEFYQNYDPEDHVMMWVEAKINGRPGIPSVIDLAHDAIEIEKMLCELAESINDALSEELEIEVVQNDEEGT